MERTEHAELLSGRHGQVTQASSRHDASTAVLAARDHHVQQQIAAQTHAQSAS
jgi:hypothetical protein